MPKHFDADIIQFLKKPENLAIALEIEHYASELRERLSSDFWSRLRAKLLAEKAPAFGKTDFSVDRIGSTGSRGWSFMLKYASGQPQALGFGVEWESLEDNHDIYVGLRWKIPVPKKDKQYSYSVLADLRSLMMQDGYEPWEPWWICGRYILNYPNPDAFLIAYNNEAASIEGAISTAFWKMATDYKRSVDQINTWLNKN